ncbi:MAG: thrombospondin type 3 repeat-containing protein [Saprospiraceae bacterium]|nr:thrombospondin type 3 repeat-containing protein [Saprospiraceae bacterium]
MKKISIVFVLVCVLVFAASSTLTAQKKGYNAVGAKVLFIDYGYANGIDSLDITNGLELQYLRSFNNWLSLSVPVKLGVADVVDDINNKTFFSVDGILQLKYERDSSWITPYLMGGVGWVNEDFEENNTNVPLGLGLNFELGSNAMINLQGEYRVALVENRSNIHLGLGLLYKLTTQDMDKDGIPDSKDECPNEAGTEMTNGCPDTDLDGIRDSRDKCPTLPGKKALRGCPDTDGDGVTDNVDPCPEVAGDQNGCPDQDGDGVNDGEDDCPTTAGVKALMGCPDADGDGIKDSEDKCPNEAGDAMTGGCPDSDKDGIIDREDKCPNQAGAASAEGCPDADVDGIPDNEDRCPNAAGEFDGCPDTDGDGIDDGEDRCPNVAGTASNKGCPEIEKEEQERLDFAAQAVQFETGKATLKAESYSILNEIVGIMKKYKGYQLRISGHTDNTGDEDRNLQLSKERAKACFDYLAAQGISIDRMVSDGFGESQPIASNSRSAGRRKNRRVEFELYID